MKSHVTNCKMFSFTEIWSLTSGGVALIAAILISYKCYCPLSPNMHFICILLVSRFLFIENVCV